MAKSLLYRLFGVGKLSKEVVDNLNREELLLMDEGIGGSMTYRDFHAPGNGSVGEKWHSPAQSQ